MLANWRGCRWLIEVRDRGNKNDCERMWDKLSETGPCVKQKC
jgi:hypothetical protein